MIGDRRAGNHFGFSKANTFQIKKKDLLYVGIYASNSKTRFARAGKKHDLDVELRLSRRSDGLYPAKLADEPHFSNARRRPAQFGLVFHPAAAGGDAGSADSGYYSDRTWKPRLGGRRLPYLLYGTLIAVIVMILMPNSGSFGFGYASLAALSFGALMIALLDVSSNMAMQPFKMMVGDMVNEEQKSYAYGIQSFLANTDAVVAAILPFVFAYIGLANTVEKGVVPQTVVVAFYVGAALLIITSAFTISKVKEYDPETYARYHGIDVAANQEKANWFELLKTAPKVFWTVTPVQFFCWFAFRYMWTYSAGAIAENVWHTTDASSVGHQEAGNRYGVLAAV
ncbi:MFS transporter [Neisseria gonorrhoeae]